MIDQSLIFLVISWALAIAYLIFQGINRRWEALGSFVVIFAILYFLKVELKLNLLLSIVGATIVALPRANISSQNNEHFENNVKDDDDNSETEKKGSHHDNDDENNNDDDGKNENENKKDDEEDEKFENPRVDAFSTFMETYKSLTPNQIENMTSDTKELIATQKSLLDTVKSLAPVVSQGKEMLDTFKDYFGPGETQNIMSMFSPKSGGDSKKKK